MTITTYVSTSSDRARRGVELGEALRAKVRHTVDFYLRLFAESGALTVEGVQSFGAAVRRELSARHPGIAEEIRAIARGAAVEEDLLMAVNARTELMSVSALTRGRARAECSHAALLPFATANGHTVVGQTWDFHPELYDARVLWTLPSCSGGSLVTFTEAGILAKIGMNSHGVSCLLAFLACAADRPHGGMPAHLLSRMVLERATNAAEALRIVHAERTSASVAITIASAGAPGEGFVAACECSAGRVGLTFPDDRGVLVQTNHFTALTVERDVALEPEGWHGSIVRRDFMTRWLRERAGGIDGDDLDTLLASRFGAPDAICVTRYSPSGNWSEELETLATGRFDLHDLSARFTDGARGAAPVTVRLEADSVQERAA